jgi:hypothetical protein
VHLAPGDELLYTDFFKNVSTSLWRIRQFEFVQISTVGRTGGLEPFLTKQNSVSSMDYICDNKITVHHLSPPEVDSPEEVGRLTLTNNGN